MTYGNQSAALATLERRIVGERREALALAMRADRRQRERRAAMRAAITSARQADWFARYTAAAANGAAK